METADTPIRPPPDVEPVPVVVTGPTPIPVIVTGRLPTKSQIQDQSIDPSLPAQSTFQQDLTHAGQRHINLIWERTQAAIALGVVFATMGCGTFGMLYNLQIPTLMAVAFGTVVGFYFSRTNHAAIGGVGDKRQGPYEGR